MPNANKYEVFLYDENEEIIENQNIVLEDGSVAYFYDNSFRFVNLHSGKYYKTTVQAFNDVTFSNVETIEQYTRLQPFKERR